MRRPTIPGSAPNRRRQRPWLITATLWLPFTSCSAVNTRPSFGADTEDLEEIGRNAGAAQGLRLTAVMQRDREAGCCGESLEHVLESPIVHDIRKGQRQRSSALARPRSTDGDETVRLPKWQSPQDDRIDDRKNGGCGPDAERQHSKDYSGEGGAGQETAHGVAQVEQNLIEIGQRADGIDFLELHTRVTELEPRFAAGSTGDQPRATSSSAYSSR